MRLADYETYLFDWDGTITNTMPVWLGLMRQHLTSLGLAVTDEMVEGCAGDWKNMLEYGAKPVDIDAYDQLVRKIGLARLAEAPMFPGARAVLSDLSAAGKKLAVVTSMQRHVITAMLARHKCERYFQVVICGEDVPELKPDPGATLMALRRLDNAAVARSVMIGDVDRDLVAARRAKIASCLFYPAEHRALYDLDSLIALRPDHLLFDWHDFGRPPQSR